jgi:NADH:ubiquinone oxidoreductase subunit 4 (subunit M)
MVIWLGVQPNFVLDRIGPSVENLLNNYYTAISLPTDELARMGR